MKKRMLLTLAGALFFSGFSVPALALVDMSLVDYDEVLQMYVPPHTHYCILDTTNPEGGTILEGVFVNVIDGATAYQLFLSSSGLTDADTYWTKLSLEDPREHTAPYELLDQDYIIHPDETQRNIEFALDYTKSGLGKWFLDFTASAVNPLPHNSVWPGNIVGLEIRNSEPFYAWQFYGLEIVYKNQSESGWSQIDGVPALQRVVIPEPATVLLLGISLLGLTKGASALSNYFL